MRYNIYTVTEPHTSPSHFIVKEIHGVLKRTTYRRTTAIVGGKGFVSLSSTKGKIMQSKELGQNLLCPRCLGGIPSTELVGMYPGALSRTDNKTEICSECGTLEGIEDYTEGAPKPQSHWMVQEKK